MAASSECLMEEAARAELAEEAQGECRLQARAGKESNAMSSVGCRGSIGGLSPVGLLLLFCSINLLNYIDRGAIASNGVNGAAASPDCALHSLTSNDTGEFSSPLCVPGSGIQGEFELTNFEDGLLPTAFLVGLLGASPAFAYASKTQPHARLMAFGLLAWTVAVVGCALSWGLVPLLLCRTLVGLGEASFISLAAPCIDDIAPSARVSQWLACFYLCIPAGFALGYIFGGVVGTLGGWRAAFLVEALLMLPFVVFLFRAAHYLHDPASPETQAILGKAKGEEEEEASGCDAAVEGGLSSSGGPGQATEDEQAPFAPPHSLHSLQHSPLPAPSPPHQAGPTGTAHDLTSTALSEDLLSLLCNQVFVTNVLGYSLYTFVIGAYAFWAPKAMKELFSTDQADSLFGGITVVTGIGGTLAGGLLLDALGSSIATAFRVQAAVTLIGGILCFAAFCASDLVSFVALVGAGELFLFAAQVCANVVSMQCVPPLLRALSIASSTVLVHLLGDVPSPPLLGALQDAVGSWRWSMGAFTAVLLPSSLCWFYGSLISHPSPPSPVQPLSVDGVEGPEDALRSKCV